MARQTFLATAKTEKKAKSAARHLRERGIPVDITRRPDGIYVLTTPAEYAGIARSVRSGTRRIDYAG